MSEINKIIVSIGIGLVIVLTALNLIEKLNDGYKLSITNKTDSTITDLEIRYKVGGIIKTVSKIEPNKSWKEKIDTKKVQGEDSIFLIYKDKKGNIHDKCLVGYLEHGYSGQAYVIINQIDENGKLDISLE
ncbi:hypothetical protein [Faecalimicrobium dakarense]|uniref:hypothetical protein n=1 Tax=Faecalimicrobium dakarense TaxID=1301100 RepID=UPI0004B70276|nr:hypothetical protein [[Clostridium] dakarense]